MKKLILLVASIAIIASACSDDDEPNDNGPNATGCYEFVHSIRYRSPDALWHVYNDTICHITEDEAESYRAKNDINDSKWIRNCRKQRIVTSHTHKNRKL